MPKAFKASQRVLCQLHHKRLALLSPLESIMWVKWVAKEQALTSSLGGTGWQEDGTWERERERDEPQCTCRFSFEVANIVHIPHNTETFAMTSEDLLLFPRVRCGADG